MNSSETENLEIRKSLKYAIYDGAFWAVMFGFGDSFFSVFAVFLKASNIMLGLLGTFPVTLGSLLQLFSIRLLSLFKTRKKLVTFTVLCQAFVFIFVILSFYLGKLSVLFLLFSVCLFYIFGMICSPAWNSWMGDLLKDNERGVYFSRRIRIIGLIVFLSFLLAGYILQLFSRNKKFEYFGFVAIFMIALVARLFSYYYIKKQYEPPYRIEEEEPLKFKKLLSRGKNDNFRMLVFYLSFMNFSVFVCAPFFTPYMLYDLKLDYFTFTIILATSLLIKVLMLPIVGILSDRYGTRKILVFSGSLMPLISILWIFSYKVWYLIVIQVYNGFVWAGFELSSIAFLYDTTKPKNRATSIVFFNLISGLTVFIAALLGGIIVKYNNLFWSKYYLVFLVSGVLRLIASVIYLPNLKEVRKVEDISYKGLFLKILTAMPTSGIIIRPFLLKKAR